MVGVRFPPRPQPRPLAAFVRVARAPGFVLGLWVVQMVFAKLLAAPLRGAAQAGLRGGYWFEDGHRLRAVVELLISEPAIAATLVAALSASATLGVAFSVLAAPAMLTRLSGERSAAAVLGPVGSKLPAMLVQTGYGLVFRAVCTGLAAIPAALLGAPGIPLVLLVASFPILVLDRARAAVVLDGQRPYHPKTFLRAIVDVARQPRWWLVGAVVETLAVAVGVGALLLVVQASPGALWIARFAGLVALVLGLWRVALATDGRS